MSEPLASQPFWRIQEWFPDLDSKVNAQLREYFDLLSRFNTSGQLVSLKTMPFCDALHYADCIYASRSILSDAPTIKELYDLGSGSGFPGLVFACLYPEIKVCLVDLDPKKCEFLKLVIDSLKLKNCEIMPTAIEKLKVDSVNYGVCRGFATIPKMLLASRKFFTKGGTLYHMKGEEWSMELSQIPTQLCSVWAPALVGSYAMPVGGIKFSVVKTVKLG